MSNTDKITLRGEGTTGMFFALQNILRGRTAFTSHRTAENAPQRGLMRLLSLPTQVDAKEAAVTQLMRRLNYTGGRPNMTYEGVSDISGQLTRQVEGLVRLDKIKRSYPNDEVFVFSRLQHPYEDSHIGVGINGTPKSTYRSIGWAERHRGDWSALQGFAKRLEAIAQGVRVIRDHYITLSDQSRNDMMLEQLNEKIAELTTRRDELKAEEDELMEWFTNRPAGITYRKVIGQNEPTTDSIKPIINRFLDRYPVDTELASLESRRDAYAQNKARGDASKGELFMDPTAVQEAYRAWVESVVEWLWTPPTEEGEE